MIEAIEIGTEKLMELISDGSAVALDLRAPVEFEAGSAPGASNIPLLDDDERRIVGTLYKQEGATKAWEKGFEIVGTRLEELLNRIKSESTEKNKAPILFCARGGARSKSVSTLCQAMNIKHYFLTGGFKAYRRYLLDFLEAPYPFELVTVYGLTGSGKTELLNELQLRSLPVMDLEKLACHRGSAFGQVGIPVIQKQKIFDTLLFQHMWRFKQSKTKQVVIEGESRRIGPVLLTTIFMESMKKGKKVHLSCSHEARVERIVKEYLRPVEGEDEKETRERLKVEIKKALENIKERLGGVAFNQMSDHLEEDDFREITSFLLTNYYDRFYQDSHQDSQEFDLTLEGDDIPTLADKFSEWFEKV